MIDSVITVPENPNADYPKLMKSIRNNIIVLFTKGEEGTVIGNPTAFEHIGYHNDKWSACLFVDYNGTVSLSNSK